MKINRPGLNIPFKSLDELLGADDSDGITELPVADIHPFSSHPFKVSDDKRMEDLIQSIKENGVMTPILVRPVSKGGYELISGHRRMYAVTALGLSSIPAVIREMDDDEAVIAMVDSNIQRDALLPSEKAYAYKMRMDAVRHQGRRTEPTSRQFVEKLSADETGTLFGESGRQVQRFVRLTELIPNLLSLIDARKIGFCQGVELSYLSKDDQECLYDIISEYTIYPKREQAKQLRELASGEELSTENVLQILCPQKEKEGPSRSVLLSEAVLGQYFDVSYSEEQILEIIHQQLSRWAEQNAVTHAEKASVD
jgi:ParB family chromosome partitioning protein